MRGDTQGSPGWDAHVLYRDVRILAPVCVWDCVGKLSLSLSLPLSLSLSLVYGTCSEREGERGREREGEGGREKALNHGACVKVA